MTTGSNKISANRVLTPLRVLACIAICIGLLLAAGLRDNSVRSLLEYTVTKLTARELLIRGDFTYSLGSTIRIQASDIVWANASWAEGPYMLKLDAVDVSIDTRSLINMPVVITNARVDGGYIELNWSDKNAMNWALQLPGSSTSSEESEAPQESLPLQLEAAKVSSFDVRATHPGLSDTLVLKLLQAEHTADSKQNLVLGIDASLDDRPIRVEGTIGPFPKLIVAGEVTYDLTARGKVSELDARGHFENLANLQDPELYLRAVSSDAAIVFKQLKLPPVASGNIDLLAAINMDDGTLLVETKGHIGDFNLDVSLHTKSLTHFDDLKLSLTADGPSSEKAGRLFGIEGLPDSPYKMSASALRVPDGIKLESFALNAKWLQVEADGIAHKLPELKDFDLNLTANAESLAMIGKLLSVDGLPDVPFQTTATIVGNGTGTNDHLTSETVMGGVTLNLDADITERAGFEGSNFSGRISASDPRPLFKSIGLLLKAPVDINIPVTAGINNGYLNINTTDSSIGTLGFGLSGQAALPGKTPVFQGEFKTSVPDLNTITSNIKPDTELPPMPEGPVSISGNLVFDNNIVSLKTDDFRYADNHLNFDGTINLNNLQQNNIPEIDADIGLRGPDLSHLLKSFDLTYAGAAAFEASSHISVSGENSTLSALKISVNGNELTGRLSAGWPLGRHIDFDLKAKGSSLQQTLPVIGKYTPPEQPFDISTSGTFIPGEIDIAKLDATIGKARISAGGRLAFKPKLLAEDIRVDMQGPDISELGTYGDIKPAALPFSLYASMQEAGKVSSIKDLNIKVGDSDLKGQIHLTANEIPHLEATLKSSLIDIQPFFPGKTENGTNAGTNTDTDKQAADDVTKRLFSKEPIDLSPLNTLNAKISIDVQQIKTAYRELNKGRIEGTLQDGLLKVDKFQINTHNGNILASLTLDAKTSKTETNIRVQNVGMSFRGMTDEQKKKLPLLQVSADLTSEGNSPALLAANLNGYAWVDIGAGIRPALGFNLIFGDFMTTLVQTLNPFSKSSDETRVNCGGLYVEAQKGILETAPAFIIQTDKISIGAKGAINLKTEKIDIVFNTTPLKGIGLSASDIVNPFIKLGGTLANPQIVMNPTDAAIQSGAAVATMGLSVVGSSLWRRWVTSKDACKKIEEEAVKIRSGIEPSKVPKWFEALTD